ncbi:two-component sensor histidine kinase [Spongiactinospora rosea]|uniref:histidine kinase n=1 Tax=Spongiactinospora rosea TaxID=2248750 RepID=A0A366LPV0_9ACTN|nr:HAMP domain-containing sensor histidine kinase [Spongiactinospora rosea]RBQ15553.1 two-component sensor histidine kinase [Spongiactinospora rosea]
MSFARPGTELKRRLARTPLWARLVAGTLVLVAAAIALTGLFAVQSLRTYLMERVDHQLRAATKPLDRGDDEPPEPPKLRPQRLYGLFHMVVMDAAGNVARTLAESTDGSRPALPHLTPGEFARREGRPFSVGSVEPGGPQWRAVAVVDRYRQSKVIAVSLADIDRTVSRLVVIVAGAGTAVLLILGVACHWLVRRSLRPLGEIERTAEAIAGGDLSRRVPSRHRRTEMGRLGRAVNGMLAQIEKALRDRSASEAAARRAASAARSSEERMRRFVADASHELRTPLTSIRGFAEFYRHNPAGDVGSLLRRIEDEAARMGVLVDDLLLLARLDQRRPLERRPVDLLSLAAGAVLDAQTLAPGRPVELVRLDEGDGPVVVAGDEAGLRQVLGNLVGNALRHTPADVPVVVRVGVSASGEAVVEVADEGPGLAAPDVERIFERFYRADPSRSRVGGEGGTGLGLSIAAALVEAHGGSIGVDSAPGRGAVFHFRIPTLPDAL